MIFILLNEQMHQMQGSSMNKEKPFLVIMITCILTIQWHQERESEEGREKEREKATVLHRIQTGIPIV